MTPADTEGTKREIAMKKQLKTTKTSTKRLALNVVRTGVKAGEKKAIRVVLPIR